MLSWASSVRKKVSSSARSRATQVAASVGWQKVSQVASSFSSSVASGPYIYVLQEGPRRQFGKMMLLR